MFKKILALFLLVTSLTAQEAVIKGSLGRYAKGQPNLEDFRAGGPIETSVMQMEVKSDFRMRYVAAQWLLAAQTLRFQNPSLGAGNPRALFDRAWWLGWGAYLDAMSSAPRELSGAERATMTQGFDQTTGARRADTKLTRQEGALELLSIRDLDRDFIIKMRNLNLSIALGMEDWNKVAQALTVMEGDLNLPGVDLQAVFYAAAHTGHLPTFAKVAKGMPESAMKSFHTKALASPTEVDYSALLRLAEQPLPSVGQMPSFNSYTVQPYRVRLINAEGSNATRVDAAKRTLSEWQSRDASAFVDRPFQRIGAVAHWLKPGQANLPLTGIWGENALMMVGYSDQGDGETRTETWTLRPSPTQGLWSGTVIQETVSKSGERLVLKLEAEIGLK